MNVIKKKTGILANPPNSQQLSLIDFDLFYFLPAGFKVIDFLNLSYS